MRLGANSRIYNFALADEALTETEIDAIHAEFVSRTTAEAPSFEFTDLTNIRAWYEDDDETTITESGGLVSQQDDKSGNGYHRTQDTASVQPETGLPAREINGLNAFDWANDYMLSSGFRFTNTSDFTYADGISIAFVCETDSVSTGSQNHQILDSTVGSTGVIIRLDDDVMDFYMYDDTNTLRGVNDAGSMSVGVPSIFIVKFLPTGVFVWQDGVFAGSEEVAITGIGGSTDIVFGSRIEGNGNWEGSMPFFITCNDDWSTEEMNNIFGLLSERYDIPVAKVPDTIPDLARWFDASDDSTITESGGSVSQWDDKSGNDRHATQGSASAQPTYDNGDDSLEFNGTSDYLSLDDAFMWDANGVTVFVVGNGASQSDKRILAEGNSSDTTPLYSIVGTSNGGSGYKYFIRNDGGSILLADDPLVPFDDNRFIGVIQDTGSTMEASVNGGSMDVSSYTRSGDITLDTLTIGALERTSVGSYFTGKINEIIIYDRVLTDLEINQIGKYLEDKWGVTWTSI